MRTWIKMGTISVALLLCSIVAGAEAQSAGKHLLLDSRVIEKTDNVHLSVGTVRKHPANPVFGEDKPWEVRYDNLYANIMYDAQEKLYKCWYNPFIIDESASNTPRAQRDTTPYKPTRGRETGVCYAISRDGIKWEKPSMGLVEFNGSKDNNLLLRNTHGPGIFRDDHDADSNRRYKMFQQGMAVRFSPDGIHWSEPLKCKEISAAGDAHNNALWAPELRKYVGFTRRKVPHRIVVRTESPDFVHWTKAEEIYRGDIDNQTYAMPVFRYGNVYLGLVMIYRVHSDDRVACELAWSPDAITWKPVDPGHAIIPLSEKKGEYDWGCIYAAAYPVVLENEIRIYYGASNGTHSGWRDGFLALATLRKDGWAGYQPVDSTKPGVVVTSAVVCASESLRLTADATGGSVRVVVMGEDGKEIATSKAIEGDVTDQAVVIEGNNPLANRQGQAVKLRFELTRAKLYSFEFSR